MYGSGHPVFGAFIRCAWLHFLTEFILVVALTLTIIYICIVFFNDNKCFVHTGNIQFQCSIKLKMGVYNLSEWFNVYTIFIAALVILLLSWNFKKRKNLPPGPWSLPLIGCVPSLAYTMYRTRDDPGQMLAQNG